MATSHSPVGSRRRLGAELRRMRTAAGLTLDEVAERMTCSTSKISRLETGKGIPKVPDVRELMRIYDVRSAAVQDVLLQLVHDGREQGWWESYVDGVAPERYMLDVPGRYPSLEGDAQRVRSFDLTILHGLLQTEQYMRSVITSVLPHHGHDEIEQLVALRLRRQQALIRDAPPPLDLCAVIDESVLRRPVGGVGVMAEQMAWLLTQARQPNVTVRVVPLGVGLLRAHAGHFVLLDIPDELGSDIVYIESHAGDSYLSAASDLQLYDEVFTDVFDRSLGPEDSIAIIDRYRARHTPR